MAEDYLDLTAVVVISDFTELLALVLSGLGLSLLLSQVQQLPQLLLALLLLLDVIRTHWFQQCLSAR
uniref:Uncharacterized protein n=1 Tax=Peronospora matthiolae TaxID=2874970 RepID=A0AAV1TNB6_9STRA